MMVKIGKIGTNFEKPLFWGIKSLKKLVNQITSPKLSSVTSENKLYP
jgi:hypothetical protein